MKPDVAYDYVKSIRQRVLVASSQLQAVQEFYNLQVKAVCISSSPTSLVFKSPKLFTGGDLLAFDDGSVVKITNADLDGYVANQESAAVRNEIWADFSLIYRVRVTRKTALAKLSCLWFRCHTPQKVVGEEVAEGSSCLVGADMKGFTLDIHVCFVYIKQHLILLCILVPVEEYSKRNSNFLLEYLREIRSKKIVEIETKAGDLAAKVEVKYFLR